MTDRAKSPTLGVTFFFDTNVVGDQDQAWHQLRRLADRGAIELRKADILGTELARDRDSSRRARLETEANYPQLTGVFVSGESRPDEAFTASASDRRLFADLFGALFPGTTRKTTSRSASNSTRDVMHLHTAIRYGADAFLTHEKRLLKRRLVLREQFGIDVLEPAAALRFVERLQRRAAARAAATPRSPVSPEGSDA